MSRFDALALHTAISKAISALMLLKDLNVNAAQRTAIFTPSSSSVEYSAVSESLDEMLESRNYNAVANVMLQFDEQGSKGTARTTIVFNAVLVKSNYRQLINKNSMKTATTLSTSKSSKKRISVLAVDVISMAIGMETETKMGHSPPTLCHAPR